MPPRFTYLIIGAGPTGLGAAYRLQELGEQDFLIVDKANHAGGLASSVVDPKGFTWDIGGHVHFSHYPYYDQMLERVLGSDNWYEHARVSAAWMQERFVPYPVQHHLHHLPPTKAARALYGLVQAQKRQGVPPAHFGEWVHANFGRGLAELFMLPYNTKVWAWPPDSMSYSWLGERVAKPSVSQALSNMLQGRSQSTWGPNRTFRFPMRGGTGSIWRAVAEKIPAQNVAYRTSVATIDTDKKVVHTSDGATYQYEHILNTAPLTQLCNMLTPQLPTSSQQAAKQLRHSSVHIVGLGLNGAVPEHVRGKSWMYFPEANCPFYRATVFSGYSPAHVPDPTRQWSLMTETSSSPWKPVDQNTLVEETIQGCLNTRLIRSRDDIVSVWTHTAKHGYPTPSLARDDALNELIPTLEERGIASRGRFGGWKYEVSNQDHSFMQGVEWADRMINGTPEVTYFYPDTVNTRTPRS